MEQHNQTSKNIHQGRNIKRFREMLGIKQEALAMELGLDWTQKKISLMEAREKIDADILKQVAAILKVPVEAIEKMDEEKALNIISNTFNDSSFLNAGSNSTFHINSMEKWLEALEEIKLLHAEIKKLYERLLEKK